MRSLAVALGREHAHVGPVRQPLRLAGLGRHLERRARRSTSTGPFAASSTPSASCARRTLRRKISSRRLVGGEHLRRAQLVQPAADAAFASPRVVVELTARRFDGGQSSPRPVASARSPPGTPMPSPPRSDGAYRSVDSRAISTWSIACARAAHCAAARIGTEADSAEQRLVLRLHGLIAERSAAIERGVGQRRARRAAACSTRTCCRIASDRRMLVAAIATVGFFSNARAIASSNVTVSIGGCAVWRAGALAPPLEAFAQTPASRARSPERSQRWLARRPGLKVLPSERRCGRRDREPARHVFFALFRAPAIESPRRAPG